MKIKVFTNIVYGGWQASDLDSGIGGSEEKLIEWAREMAKKHDVTIYHNGTHGDFDGVHYVEHGQFKPWEKHDVFISFKAKGSIVESVNADKIIHWTTEIEPKWGESMLNNVDHIITISDYQLHRMESNKAKTEYLWADLERLDKNKTNKEEGTILYSSSYDRGLEELLVNWTKIQEALGVKKLYITYGWDFMKDTFKSNPQLLAWKDRMDKLMKQDGIEVLGRLNNDEMCKMYWESEYWCLPLNNPDSELFCINAVKAQYCEAKPLVRRIGALQETVGKFIDFDELLGQKVGKSSFGPDAVSFNKRHAQKFNLEKAIARWESLMAE